MKKNKLLNSSALIATAPMLIVGSFAKADSSNFEGAFASVGVSTSSTDVSFDQNAGNIPAKDVNGSSSEINAAFVGFETSASTIIGRAASKFANDDSYESAEATLGYNYAINDKFLIGLDITGNTGGYDFTKTSDYTQSTAAQDTDAAANSSSISVAQGTQTTKYTEDETYSIGIRPSYAINDKAMAYARIGYGQTKGKLSTSYSIAADTTANKTVEDDLESYHLGLGAVYNINDRAFIDVSLNYRNTEKLVNDIDDSGQTASVGSLSLTSATNNLKTAVTDNETYGASIKVGVKF